MRRCTASLNRQANDTNEVVPGMQTIGSRPIHRSTCFAPGTSAACRSITKTLLSPPAAVDKTSIFDFEVKLCIRTAPTSGSQHRFLLLRYRDRTHLEPGQSFADTEPERTVTTTVRASAPTTSMGRDRRTHARKMFAERWALEGRKGYCGRTTANSDKG